MDMRSDPAGLA